jgi:hypothetical protein
MAETSLEHVTSRGQESAIAVAWMAIGFIPISTVAAGVIGLAPMHLLAAINVSGTLVVAGLLAARLPWEGRIAVFGLLHGLAAVFVYDALARWPFVWLGMVDDFIPRMGGALLGQDSDWRVGYLWRYFGNGGGMGLAFTVGFTILRPRIQPLVAGLLFGVFVWACLMATLVLAPHGEAMLFPLTPKTFAISLLGHLVYGAVLGLLVRRNLA